MTLPVYLHSGMVGAPQYVPGNGSTTALLTACLVNGFNTQAVSSATASGGVVTFNFPTAPGFSALDTVTIAGASNAMVNGKRRVQSAASNQVLVAIPGVPDGAVGGAITIKFAPLGWTRPYSGTNKAVYRQGGSASHKRFLRVVDDQFDVYQKWFFRCYESMSSVDAGAGPFPTVAQQGGDGYAADAPYPSKPGPMPWVIVGTPRAFHLMYLYYYNDSVPTQLEKAGLRSWYFGELANLQKPADARGFAFSNSYSWPQYGSTVIERDHTGTGDPVVNAQPYGGGGHEAFSLAQNQKYPEAASGNLTLVGPAWVTDGDRTPRGTVPGLLCPLSCPVYYGNLAPGTILENVSGVTGRVLLRSSGDYTSGDAALLLDEDWGDV